MPRPTNQAPEQLLTIKEAAILCRVSEKTIRRWISAGDLTAAKLGAQWRIRPRDLDLFIRERLKW
jgi:excisionase family DNA binding protein